MGKECFSGLDLASHIDLNALAHFFPDVNGVAVAKLISGSLNQRSMKGKTVSIIDFGGKKDISSQRLAT